MRQVLGHHVVQKGSLVSDTALRFDFAHPEAITKAQLNKIETLVNQKVRENFVASQKSMMPSPKRQKRKVQWRYSVKNMLMWYVF